MAEEVLFVVSTFASVEEAQRIARLLVEERLAACVNCGPAVESIYRWQGKIESAQEVVAFIKTTIGRYPALESRLCDLHPYEVPELVAFRAADGLPAYLRWVEASCADEG